MSVYKPTARRSDPAPGPDEIELSPGTLAQAPRRVSEKNAVLPLREMRVQIQKFEQETVESLSRLDAARLTALELQASYELLLEERAGLVKNIGSAEYELALSKSRMLELDAYVRTHWLREGEGMQDQIEEHGRRAFFADPARLPRWIEEWNFKLRELNKRIAAFEKLNGVGEKLT